MTIRPRNFVDHGYWFSAFSATWSADLFFSEGDRGTISVGFRNYRWSYDWSTLNQSSITGRFL